MQTKFNGNYIKRISYYVGIIAFIAYLIIALVMWIMDINKEVDNIVNNAKAELAPFIEWYEKDSTKELESIQNLTQESLNALNINATIHQNLQDIQKVIDNTEILSNFILPYDDENGARKTFVKGMRAVIFKTYIILDLLGKERDFNPNQTYFILHDKERTQDYQNFLDFLESRINNDFSNSKKLEKASLDKIGIYYFAITTLLEIPNYLILSDIEKNTCDVSQQEIQRVIQRYELIKMNFDTISKLLDKQMLQSEKQEKAKDYKNEVEKTQENLQKDEKVISTIQSNLKACK